MRQSNQSMSTKKDDSSDNERSACRPRSKSIDKLITQFFDIVSLEEFSKEMLHRESPNGIVTRTGTETSWSCDSPSANGKTKVNVSVSNSPEALVKEVKVYATQDQGLSGNCSKNISSNNDPLIVTSCHDRSMKSSPLHQSWKGMPRVRSLSSDASSSDTSKTRMPQLYNEASTEFTDTSVTNGTQSKRFKLRNILRRKK